MEVLNGENLHCNQYDTTVVKILSFRFTLPFRREGEESYDHSITLKMCADLMYNNNKKFERKDAKLIELLLP